MYLQYSGKKKKYPKRKNRETAEEKASKKVYAEMYDSGDYNSAMLFGFLSESSERK